MLNIASSPVAALFAVGLLPHVATARQHVSRGDAFADFNITVGGRLKSATPLALPCFSNYDGQAVTPDPQACALAQQNYGSQSYRSLRYGNTINVAGEACVSQGEQCWLDYTNPANPAAYNGTVCSQGSISDYYLEVQDAADVLAAYAFSKATGIPLSIKNSGHDFMGRSNLKGSLALWMRNLTSLSYHDAFIPTGCPAETTCQQAITAGTGAITADVYKFADAHNVTAVGGFADTIAWHGGWLMGGGHSVLSPVYGLGVDSVLEFKVVTPDGQIRIANKCQNTDLFWALRGGGGGTFGVVLEATSRVEKQLTLQMVTYTIDPKFAPEFYGIIVNNTEKWSSEGWGGFTSPTFLSVLANSLLSLEDATTSMKPLSDFIIANGGNFTLETVPSWYTLYSTIGGTQLYALPQTSASRLIPKANFATEESRAALINFLSQVAPPFVNFATPVLYNGTANETSVTPAWRDSYWHLVGGATWNFNYTVSQVEEAFELAQNETLQMIQLAPNSGAYVNEACAYEPDHEQSFWGENYPALLSIKNKYDPDGLLDCWYCVGWKPGSPKFDCYFDLS